MSCYCCNLLHTDVYVCLVRATNKHYSRCYLTFQKHGNPCLMIVLMKSKMQNK